MDAHARVHGHLLDRGAAANGTGDARPGQNGGHGRTVVAPSPVGCSGGVLDEEPPRPAARGSPRRGIVPGADCDHAPTSFWSRRISGGCGCASEAGDLHGHEVNLPLLRRDPAALSYDGGR